MSRTSPFSHRTNMHTIIVMFIVDQYELVAEKTSCLGGTPTIKGSLKTVEECGVQCTNVAPMFIYGTGGDTCNSDGCYCYCMLDASTDETCTQESNPYFDLYKFIKKGTTL